MKAVIVLGTVTATLVAATVLSDGKVHKEIPIEIVLPDESEMSILKESRGEISEYPSLEDAAIIMDMEEDTLTHYLFFQETPNGDVYSIK